MDEKGWSNNLGGTAFMPIVEGSVGGELEGGELCRPFFFFFETGLNGMSSELLPAVSMSS